jgi:hypothetical protein
MILGGCQDIIMSFQWAVVMSNCATLGTSWRYIVITLQLVTCFGRLLSRAITMVFGWRLLRDRLPKQMNLWHYWGILLDNHQHNCVFCFHHVESPKHLFFLFHVTVEVWSAIFSWLNWSLSSWEDDKVQNLAFCNITRGISKTTNSVMLCG